MRIMAIRATLDPRDPVRLFAEVLRFVMAFHARIINRFVQKAWYIAAVHFVAGRTFARDNGRMPLLHGCEFSVAGGTGAGQIFSRSHLIRRVVARDALTRKHRIVDNGESSWRKLQRFGSLARRKTP